MSSTANDIDHLFGCSQQGGSLLCLVLGNIWWHLLPLFKTGSFVFLLLSYKCSLYVPDTSPLSDVCISNVFYQSVAFFFSSLMMPLNSRYFWFWWSPIYSFLFFIVCCVFSKKSLLPSRSKRFFFYFSSNFFFILWF